ncbi:MAG TPA: hypothetical protein VHF06_24790 [Pseudonocardiaceae bacterium]|jgi:hypothetical protein|nr:hypothetical protein [Pseudonocardiaceae bacterium]
MLLGVLVLVLAALGLLVAALVTSAMLWAWGSVAASVLAAILLVVDWSRRRRRAADEEPAPPEPEPAVDEADPDAEPGEEDTDAADLLVVTDLDTEVRVLDERPRYHLATCRWVGERLTLPLPVREARELGFTPCAVCSPDRALAAGHRTAGTGT